MSGERCMDCDETAGVLVSFDVWGEPDVRWLCLPCADQFRDPQPDVEVDDE